MSGSNSLADAFSQANKPSVALQSPFQQLQQGAQAVNSANETKQFQANALRGQLIQQATGPDGTVDMQKFNQLASQAGSAYAPAAAAGLTQSADIAGQQQGQAIKSQVMQSQALASLGPNASYQDVLNKVHEGVKAGWLQPAGANAVLVGMPQGDDPQSQATRSHQLQVMSQQIMSPEQRQATQYGTSGTVTDASGRVIGTNQMPGGALNPAGGAGVQTGPSQDTQAGVSTVTRPDGSTNTDTFAGHVKSGDFTPTGAPAQGVSFVGGSPPMVNMLRGQEGTPNGQTSVSGARGQLQVTPGFFKQYAQPGESFDSKADVEAVGRRGIGALEAQYPNDPGRVATAYFSGPGNVSPPGSPTPYLVNKSDPNGASTAGYVQGAVTRYNSAARNGQQAQPQPQVAQAPTGAQPPAQQPQIAPQAGPRSGGTTVPLGTQEAATETARQSAQMGNTLVSRADQVPQNKAQYSIMMGDLGRLGSMGPGTERETLANGLAQKLTGYGITMTPEQVASGESFAKVSNQMIASQVSALGPSDSRQALAMGGTPHLDLSKQGNTEIIHVLQGNEDAINAKSQAWQKWIAPTSQGGQGNSQSSYGQFSTDFNHNFDPRVFQSQYMGPKEIANLRTSMAGQPGAEAKFMADTAYARAQGWIK